MTNIGFLAKETVFAYLKGPNGSNGYLSACIFRVVNVLDCDKNGKRALTLVLGISGPGRLIPRVECESITKVVCSWDEIGMILNAVYV